MGVPVVAQWLTNPTRNHEVAGSVGSLPLLSGLMIRRCRELWCRLQTRLGSSVAVALAQAGGYSSDSTPSLGTSICRGSGPRRGKKTKKKEKKRKENGNTYQIFVLYFYNFPTLFILPINIFQDSANRKEKRVYEWTYRWPAGT